MTTLLLEQPKGVLQPSGKQYFLSNGAFGAPKRMFRHQFERNGVTVTSLKLEKIPVFRSGTFRDSWGEQTTWNQMHMAQMVQHFSFLRDNNIFSDVPVRKGHGSMFGDPMDSLIGYMTNLSNEDMASPIDGEKYNYLFADYEILDKDAMDKIESGLWRNRSAEIGTFRTNDESEYTPTFMGFAYVDIPAVEGLNGTFSKTRDFAIAREPKENEVAKDDKTAPPSPDDRPAPAAPPVPDSTPTPPAGSAAEQTDSVDAEAVPVADGVEAIAAPAGADGSVPASAVFPAVIEEQDGPPEINHEEPGVILPPKSTKDDGKLGKPETVTEITELQPGAIFAKASKTGIEIGGRNYSLAQAADLINKYQAANVKSFGAEKKAAVLALAEGNMIMASKVDQTLAYVSGMNREQFSAWKDLQSEIPLFSGHYAAGGNAAKANDSSPETKDFEIQTAVIAQMKLMGKSEDHIRSTPAFARATDLATKLNIPFTL